jgi:hypothetical protein
MTVPYDPEHITYIAETDYRNQRARFGIKSRDRPRHMYVIGKSGVGKSTLLENMAIQDIARGEGLAVLDPHGSFAEKMLDYIPEHRIKDVIYFAPFDTDYPISFNVLEDVGADKRHFVASGLMSTFKKIWVDAWSARMEYILNNILLALLEYPEATLLGVNRMLSDKAFRDKVVAVVTDPGVKAFWVEEFAKYGDRYMQEAGAAIQNKIGQFTANPLIRNIIGQPKSSFDIREAMDTQKILIVNLSKGRIGEQNTSLLGSMIITKIYLAAMSRADASPARMAELPNFYFYVDEFQSFANESFANILSEARKYKLALVIAHQYVAQMEESVRDAVFGNVGTSISFRVGPLDGELLEKVFSPQFTANDLVNLGMAQIYLSLLINDMGSSPFSARTLPPVPKPTISYRNDVIEISRENFAKEREGVVKNIMDWFGPDPVAAGGSAGGADRPKKAFVDPGAQFAQPQRFPTPAPSPSATAPSVPQQSAQPLAAPMPASASSPMQSRPQSPMQSRPVQNSAPRPQQMHTPFKKAFVATPPAIQRVEINAPAAPQTTRPPVMETPGQVAAPARVFRPITANIPQFKRPIPGVSVASTSSTSPIPTPQVTNNTTTINNTTINTAPVAISPALNELLASLDSTEVKNTAEPIKIEATIQAAPTPTFTPAPAPAIPFAGEKPLRENIPPAKLSERGPTEKNRDLLKAALQGAIASIEKKPEPAPAASPAPAAQPVASATIPAHTDLTIQPQEIPYQELRKILE